MALVRATALKDFRTNPLSTTDVSTGFQLGPAVAGQQLYAGLHLTSVAGNGLGSTAVALVMAIQAASSSGFGVLSTMLAFALSTAQGAQWAVPVQTLFNGGLLSTDLPWYRASWTISTGAGTTGGTWKGLVWMGLRTGSLGS